MRLKEIKLYFNLLVFFIDNYIILLGSAVFKHWGQQCLLAPVSRQCSFPSFELCSEFSSCRDADIRAESKATRLMCSLCLCLYLLGHQVRTHRKKDAAEVALALWFHLFCCHKNGTLKQYRCCVFSLCRGTVVPASILSGLVFIWVPMADS